jgi:hypothetical protein
MTFGGKRWVKPARVYPAPIPEHLRRAATMSRREDVASISKAEPVRSEAYRRLVAALPCASCGIEGRSQHAHTNHQKAKGMKASDLDAMPLCADGPGYVGCHSRFDQYELLHGGREAHADQGKIWAAQTRKKIEESGLMPKTCV